VNNMFSGCSNLTSLDISYFDLTKVYDVSNILSGCRSLHTLRLDNCNYDTVKKIITSFGFPTGDIGVIRKIYCNYSAAYDLTPPDGWVFAITE
jgi:surface protein